VVDQRDWLVNGEVAAEPGGCLGCWQGEGHRCPEDGSQVVEAGGDELGRVVGWWLARRHPDPGALCVVDAVDAEGSPVGSLGVVGEQIPAPADHDQPVWFDEPPGGGCRTDPDLHRH
jgi:hypothetical protein